MSTLTPPTVPGAPGTTPYVAPATAEASGAGGVDDARRCPNCGAPAPGPYCGQCGQAQRDHLRTSLRELAHEGLEELAAWDAKIFTSLRRLLFAPGFLTAEYLAGRRVRYLRPLRLYLTTSVVFFLLFSFLPGGGVQVGGGSLSAGGGMVRIGATELPRATGDSAGTLGATGLQGARPVDSTGVSFERDLERRFARLDSLSSGERRRIAEGAQRTLPKAVFAMVPLFALLLHALHARRGWHYAEHLIFALHIHAFGFLLFTLVELFSRVTRGGVDVLALAWLLGYLFVALRRVYGRSRRGTALTMLLLVPAYSIVLSAAMVGALALVIFVP
ncbi:MAG TPA: DUF3667 domain-containing protein [Gemmatimonadaceae bacterium]|nr:DUF3667 domain-containing protein [Gemmatimonadaceae bacterium]